MLTQISAVISINIRSIPQRFWMSLATVLAIGIVVAVLLAFLAMGNGFKVTLEGSGSRDVAIILRTGSQAELNSVLFREQLNLIEKAPGIASDEKGPIISPELYLIVDALKKSTNTEANIPLRGLGVRGLELRPNMEIIEGRMFEAGKNEIVVGESVLHEFNGFELGNTVKLGVAQWEVVGVFRATGSIFASELWTDARTLQSQFDRGNTYQIIRAKLETADDLSGIDETIANDKRLNLNVKTELAYYQGQAGAIKVLVILGQFLGVAMAIGALAGALNTMFNSVSQRSGEIATLRAIGFPGSPVFIATMFESLLLAILGGLLGALAAYLFFDGLTTSTLGGSFTQVVFQFEINADVLMSGIKMAIAIGFIGGFFPALRAARLPVLLAFSASA